MLVDLLERVAVDMGGRERPGDGDDRGIGRRRLREAGQQVGRPRPVLARDDDAGPAARPGIAVGHVGAGPLVVHADELDRIGLVEPVEHFHGRRTDEPENMADILVLEGFDNGLAAIDRFGHFCVLQECR